MSPRGGASTAAAPTHRHSAAGAAFKVVPAATGGGGKKGCGGVLQAMKHKERFLQVGPLLQNVTKVKRYERQNFKYRT